MVISALLCAIGIIIPMFAPKIVVEPASFTLASHVPVFIAMFISPAVAASVALITGIGFFFGPYPPVVVLRALSHIVFAVIGAFILKKNGSITSNSKSITIFAFLISVLHAACEIVVVTFFYWGSQMTSAYYEKGYLISVMGLVGAGTIIHSMIDFSIATAIWQPLKHIISIPASAKFKTRKAETLSEKLQDVQDFN
jgi:niacin transporter